MIFHLVFAVPGLVVILRWLAPLPWPLLAKVCVAALVLAASQFHLWSRLSSGSVFAPEFARPLVLLGNWAFGSLLFLAAFQICADLGSIAAAVLRRTAFGTPDALRYGGMVLAFALAALGVYNATRLPNLTHVQVDIPNLPPAFEGYRILQLTDLYVSRLFPAAWVEPVVARANAAGADLIVITGDFIDGTVAMRHTDVSALGRLRAADGVYAVPGNHEYFFGYAEWIRHLSALDIRFLLNAHTVLQRGGDSVVLAGVTDLSAPDTGDAGPDLTKALDEAPADAPVLLLDHQPNNAQAAALRGVALQLSGHTHGGMLWGVARLVALANGGFVSGRYKVGAMTLYVSNGTALWPGFALRLGCPPEMTVITLRRGGRAVDRNGGPRRPSL